MTDCKDPLHLTVVKPGACPTCGGPILVVRVVTATVTGGPFAAGRPVAIEGDTIGKDKMPRCCACRYHPCGCVCCCQDPSPPKELPSRCCPGAFVRLCEHGGCKQHACTACKEHRTLRFTRVPKGHLRFIEWSVDL